MTTGNDTALPAFDDTTALVPVTDQVPATVAAPADTPQPVSADDAELLEALATVKAEEAGGAGDDQTGNQQQDPAQTGAPPAAAPQGQPQPPQPQGQPAGVMIPKARLDEALKQIDDLRLENARKDGMLAAHQTQRPAQPAPGQPAPQPQQTPQQQLDAIATAQEALAQRFDNGEITGVQWVKEQRTLNGQEQAIREGMLAAKLQPAAPAPAPNDELYLETLTAQLETKHPWTHVFEAVGTDADWDYLKATALQDLAAQGKQLDMSKTVDRYELRKAISEAADRLGPALVGQRAQAQGIALPGQQQRQQQTPGVPPGGKPPLSPQAAARLAALQKAQNAPPDIAALPGHGSDPAGVPTEAAIEGMSDDDFDKLPTALVNRLRGVSAA